MSYKSTNDERKYLVEATELLILDRMVRAMVIP